MSGCPIPYGTSHCSLQNPCGLSHCVFSWAIPPAAGRPKKLHGTSHGPILLPGPLAPAKDENSIFWAILHHVFWWDVPLLQAGPKNLVGCPTCKGNPHFQSPPAVWPFWPLLVARFPPDTTPYLPATVSHPPVTPDGTPPATRPRPSVDPLGHVSTS